MHKPSHQGVGGALHTKLAVFALSLGKKLQKKEKEGEGRVGSEERGRRKGDHRGGGRAGRRGAGRGGRGRKWGKKSFGVFSIH